MALTGPYFKNIREGGVQGLRKPTEVQNATYSVHKAVTIDYLASNADRTLTADEAGASLLLLTNAGTGAANLILAAALPGRIWVVQNGSGQTVTFKVSGATGIAVANGKTMVVYCHATDIQRAVADTTPTS